MPWIFWGAGALALAGGAVSGIQAKDQEKLANDPSAVGSQLAADRAPSLAARANVMFGVGALGIGAGFLWMWLTGDSSVPAHAALAPTAGRGGLGLCLAGRF